MGISGDVTKAQGRLELTRFLVDHFEEFDEIRHHLFHPHQHRTVLNPSKANAIIKFLLDQGWIKSSGDNSWVLISDADLRLYLAGGWLEELAYFAHKEAGADEIYFGQKVLWEVNGVTGHNEIDVIARRGEVLSFTSCKTIGTVKSPKHTSQLRQFITETDYWNIHFADDKGKALLIVTADFIDELNDKQHRYPQLLSRSTILDVSIAGLESLRWSSLVKTINEHWN